MIEKNRQKRRQVRVGVVGLGRMGKNHCRVFSTLAGSELVGVYDLSQDVGRAIAQKYQVTFCQSLDALLPMVDAVSIATSTPSHHEIALYCMRHGKDVFVEKPITQTIQQGEELVLAASAGQRIVQVGHIERFNPTYTELKHVVEDMNVLAVNFRRLSPFAGSNIDVDVVLDLMVHDLDLALDLAGGQPASITASGLTAFDGAIDHASVSMNFNSGPILTMTASRLTEQKVRKIDVTALGAYIEADLLNKSIAIHRSTTGEYLNQNQHGAKYRQESIVERIHVPIAEPLTLQLQHFIDCVAERRQPLVLAADGLAALRMAEQVRAVIGDRLVQADGKRGIEPVPAGEQFAGFVSVAGQA